MFTLKEKDFSPITQQNLMLEYFSSNLRVAIPGIIQSFNPSSQTVTVQPAIRESFNVKDSIPQNIQLPVLLDVPLVIPSAGGFHITFPVKEGDECLVIFADMCIDAWWQNGGVQNQIEKRRHDLSDAFCILSPSSKPNVTTSNTQAMEIKNNSGTQKIVISNTGINLVGNITVNGEPI